MDLELDWVLGKMPRKVCGGGWGGCFLPSWPFTCMPNLSPAAHTPVPSMLQEFFLQRNRPMLQPLDLTPRLSVRQALERVLRLPAVASKRYLTNKVLPKHLPCSSDFCTLPSAHPHLASHPWGLLWEPTSLKREVAKAGQPCGSLVPCSPPSE